MRVVFGKDILKGRGGGGTGGGCDACENPVWKGFSSNSSYRCKFLVFQYRDR